MVSFELAVAGVEWLVIGKMRSSVHRLMERSDTLASRWNKIFFFRD